MPLEPLVVDAHDRGGRKRSPYTDSGAAGLVWSMKVRSTAAHENASDEHEQHAAGTPALHSRYLAAPSYTCNAIASGSSSLLGKIGQQPVGKQWQSYNAVGLQRR